MAPRRSLATVLFIDIVGSTRRAAELGDRRWKALLDEFVVRTRRTLWRYGGTEENRTGDGLVATFESPACAIQCTAALREVTRELGLDLRAGIHMGEVQEKGRSLGGIAVHIAARVITHAQPGEIVVSSTVRDAVEGGEFSFEERGAHALKGVPGEWRLLVVREIPEGGAVPLASRWACRARAQPRRAAAIGGALLVAGIAALWMLRGPGAPETAQATGAAPGIAVLPFETQGEGLEPWEEGMVDLLSTNLDGVAGLRAIDSRSVLARWRDRDKNELGVPAALEMAHEVGARYALVGSATAVGPSVRLSVNVYDVEKDSTLGRARVEGSADSLFALVDRLSIDILRMILPSRSGGLPSFDLARATTSSIPALEWFLEGEAAYRRADFPSAVAAYERAIEADSTFALAYLRLAATYGLTDNVQACLGGRAGRVSQGDEETRLTDLGWIAIQRAVQFGDRLTERDAVLARAYYALFVSDLDGIEPVRIAVQRYPDDVEMWYILGELYWHLGPQALIPEEEVERALAKAIALDPRFSPAYFHRVHLAYGALDTARTKRLLDGMTGSVDPNTTWYRQFRYAYPLAYGDDAEREHAFAAIDTLPIPFMASIGFNLRAPSTMERRSRILSMALRRATEPSQVGNLAGTAAIVLINRGLVRAALDTVEAFELSPEARGQLDYMIHSRGLPIPADLLERDLSGVPVDSASAITAFYVGAYAAERGQADAAAAARARLAVITGRAQETGDPALARFAAGAGQALDGYVAWKQGREEQGLASLRDAQGKATGYFQRELVNATIRWWLASLLEKMDRAREAERYFGSFPNDPIADYRLGVLYERVGDHERARAAYARFLQAWKVPDPEVRAMADRARRYLARGSPAAR